MTRHEFGAAFAWGVSSAAYQTEGACDRHGKGASIWDRFANTRGRIQRNENANAACEFYDRYADDVQLLRSLRIPNFRFSLAWSRILPQGTGAVNPQGLDFYDRLIDQCLEQGITPWVTLYHWDLPQALEDRGGWTNRAIVDWFVEYATLCVQRYGDRVRHWMVLNEPMVFTGAGYFLGIHAPGRRGLNNFLPAVHHATLCQAEGGRVVRAHCPDAQLGTTFSCSYVTPWRANARDGAAAQRVDALLNRLFLEPALGRGYPVQELPVLKRLERWMRPEDEGKLAFPFDFIGVQNYTREVIRHSWFTPYLQARLVPAPKRDVPLTLMNWEVYPESLYHMLMQYAAYDNIPRLIVTENGAAFADQVIDGTVHDPQRLAYIRACLEQVQRAQRDGAPVDGYFIWTFTDNFEWAEGYRPRFGLVHVDFQTQRRIIKASGQWYRDFLSES